MKAQRLFLSDPALLLLLGAATLFSCALGRAAFPFWADEAYTVMAVRARDWGELLLINLRNEETPPLYFALLRLWAWAWGDASEATLRLFSALCLAATVVLTGWLGIRLWGREVGLLGALLLAVNPFARYYGQEARAYTAAMLFATLLFLAAHYYVRRPGPRSWAVYVLAGAAAFYTNYFGAFMLVGAGLVAGLLLLLETRRTRTREAWLALGGIVAAQIVIVALMLPWLPAVQYQVVTGAATAAPEGRNIWVQYLLSLLVLGAAPPDGSVLWTTLLVLIFLALPPALVLMLRAGTLEQRLFAVGLVFLPTLCVMLVFNGDGQFMPRYLLLSQPGYVLLLAAGLWPVWRGQALTRTLLAGIVLCSAIFAFTMAPNPRRQGGWDVMARQVAEQATINDAVFFAPPWAQAPFVVQYTGRPLPLYGARSFVEYYYEQGNPFVETAFERAALDAQLQAGRRAWIVWDRIYGARPPVPDGSRIDEWRYGTTTLVLVSPKQDD